MIDAFLAFCWDCLAAIWIWVFYAAPILLFWLAKRPTTGLRADYLPRVPSDLGIKGGMEIARDRLAGTLSFFHLGVFAVLLQAMLRGLIFYSSWKGDWWGFDFLRAFKVSAILYFIIVPLPAAFLAPVGYVQAPPDLTLLVATVLLILANAVGDAVSINLTIWNYRRALAFIEPRLAEATSDGKPIAQTAFDARTELTFYLFTLRDLVLAGTILIAVLMVSSVMFRIQVREYVFSSDTATLGLMLERALDFGSLRHELYWFRDDADGFFGFAGIPGMLLFSVTAFIPTLTVASIALLWMLVIPFRLLVRNGMGRWPTLILSETSAFAICLGISIVTALDAHVAYAFLITK